MSDNNATGIDLTEIKSMLDHDGSSVFKDVSNHEVDWFLRDSKIDEKSVLDKITKNNGTNKPSINASESFINNEDLDNSSSSNKVSKETSQKPNSPSKITPTSPHLNTAISNTNDNYVSKTKPSVAPIQEESVEGVHSSLQLEQEKNRQHSSNVPRRRSSIFSKFKEKFMKEESPPPAPSPNLHSKSFNSSSFSSGKESPVSNMSGGIFKDNYKLKRSNTSSEKFRGRSNTVDKSPINHDNNNNNNTNGTYSLKRSMSTPTYPNNDIDPRLDEYIRFYSRNDKDLQPQSRRGSMVGVLTNKCEATENSKSFQPSSLFTSFHRKKTPTPLTSIMTEKNRRSSESESTLTSTSPSEPSPQNNNSNPALPPSFSKLKPLKRVAFHSTTFAIDPPQQIPSRNPRKGNVEVLPNGKLKINPLTEEEKLIMQNSQLGHGGGIVIGGSSSKKAIEEAEKESSSDIKVDEHARSLGIEKPMVSHKHSYTQPAQKMQLDLMYTRCCHLREILPIPTILKQIPPGSMSPIPVLQLRNPTPTMVEIQTFADFIRIAPIVCISLDGVSLSIEQFKILLTAMAAKKQLEKLSLRNTPINEEGWQLFCWFLSRNTVLNKIDVTQCPSLHVNVLKKKSRKAGSTKPGEEIERMTCNKDNRSDMNWELFTATLVARGGIDELILTGCCIQDVNEFEKLIKLGASIRTIRLGLAYNNLSSRHLKVLYDHWIFKPFARGIDLGYNDFSSSIFIQLFLEKTKEPGFDDLIKNSNLSFISLNATNLRFSETFKKFILKILLRLPKLKYLDLSNNPTLFGSIPNSGDSNDKDNFFTVEVKQQESIVSYFTSILPLFPKLIRLHLENNNLSIDSIITIARTLPYCKNLGFFSLLGNKIDLSSATSLLQAVAYSKTLIMVDFEMDDLPSIFKEKLGVYMVRNLERMLSHQVNTKKNGETGEENQLNSSKEDFLLSEHNSISQELADIINRKAKGKLNIDDPEIQSFISKTKKIRLQLRRIMDELYQLQLKNELNIDGKEALIRFIFIEASIQKGLQLIDKSLVDDDGDEQRRQTLFRGTAESPANAATANKLECEEESSSSSMNGAIDNNNSLVRSSNSSRISLAEMERLEGKAFKYSNTIRGELESSNQSAGLFKHIDDNFLGEEIRRLLEFSEDRDSDTILKYLEELREKSIDVGELYRDKVGDADEWEKAEMESNDISIRVKKVRETLTKMARERHGLDEENPSTEYENVPEKSEAKDKSSSTSDETTTSSKKLSESPIESKESTKGSTTTCTENTTSQPSSDSKEQIRNVSTTYDAILNDLEKKLL